MALGLHLFAHEKRPVFHKAPASSAVTNIKNPSTSQQIPANTIQGLHRLSLGDKDSQGLEGEPQVEIAFSPCE